MRISKRYLAILVFVFNILRIGISQAGDLTDVRVIPDDVKAGATSIYYFEFTTSVGGNGVDVGLPVDGKIEITFPAGFTISTVLFAATQNSNMTGGFSQVSSAGRILTLERDGTGNAVSGNVELLVGAANVINLGSVQSYSATIRTRTNIGTQIDAGISALFAIEHGEVDHFTISNIGSKTAGSPFNITITARDKEENTVTDFTGTASLSDLSGTISTTTTGAFTAGVWTGSVSITKSMSGNRITATSIGKSGQSNSFNVNPAALHHFTFDAVGSPQTAGTAFTIAITAEDEFDNTVTGFTGRANLSDATGTITPSRTSRFSGGTWSGAVQITNSRNDDRITASYSGSSGTSNLFNVQAGALNKFQIAAVSTQAAGVPFSITVIALDANNNQVMQFDGTVDISDLTGTISPETSGSFNSGHWSGAVNITQVRNGNRVTVQLTGGGATGNSNNFDVIASSIDHFEIASIASPQTAGSDFSISVTAKDAQNNTVTSFTGTAAFSDLTGTISPQTSTNFVSGQWNGNVKLTQSIASNIITVTSSGKAGTSNTFAVNPSGLHHFTFSTITSPQTAGQAFNITIIAEDQYDNLVTAFTGQVDLSDGTGTLLPTNSGNFTNGSWSGEVKITECRNDLRIKASGNSRSGQSNTFNITAASLHHFTLNSISTQAAGVPFSITISALDAYDNLVTGFTNTVDISDLTGTVTPTVSNNFNNGQWSGNVTITQARSADRITVKRTGGNESGVSNNFDVISSSIDHFELSNISGAQVAGQNFTITITAKDAQNNTVTGFNGTANLRDVTGTLLPSTTTAFSSGVWSGSVRITQSIASDVITVTSSGKAGNSNSFPVNPAALDHFRFETISSPQSAGVPFSITIIAEDVYENQVTAFNARAQLTDVSGTISPTQTGNFTSGAWSGQVSITKAQEDNYITATRSSVTGQSNYFNTKAAALSKFVISQISTQFAGEAFSITLTALDENENRVTTFSGKVDISDKTGTITPTSSDNFSEGQWIGNVTISQAYQNDAITVQYQGGAQTGLSNEFNIIASSVNHFTLETITSPQIAGKAFTIKVIAQDQDSNTVTGFNGQIKLSDLTGTIAPTLTGNFVNGIWQDTVNISKSRLSNKITATNGNRAGSSNLFDVNPDALDHFTVSPITSPQVAGVPFSITISAVDRFENTRTTFSNSVQLSVPGAKITPENTGSFTEGSWTGAVIIENKQRDVFILASFNSIIGQSNSFNVEPSAIYRLILRDQPGGFGTEIGDVILTLDDKLHIYAAGYDRYANYVRDVNVNWSVTGDLDAPEPAFGTSTKLDPFTPATSGMVIGDTTGIISDSTGLVTVGSIDYVKIRTAPGNQGVELGNFLMTTDDSLILYAAGYDAGENYLGEVNVFWETTGTLFPIIADTATSLSFFPTKSKRQGMIRISHATATGDETGSIEVLAGKPAGEIVLTPTPATLPADGVSTSIVRSGPIMDADSNWVDPTRLFTVTTTEGQIIAPPDASTEYDGWQVSPGDSGIVSFVFQAATHGGTAYISINSVNGSASGTTIINISSLNILSVYAENLTVSQKQSGVPVSVEVENVGQEGLSNISAGLKFIGPAPAFENRNLDYPVVSRTDRIKSIPGSSTQTLIFMVSVGTAALTDTITIDTWVSGNIGESVVSDSNANVTDFWIVQTPAKFSIQRVEAFADSVSQGLNNVSVSMLVENQGEASASISAPALKFWSILENRYVPNDYEVFPAPHNPEIILGLSKERLNFTLNVATTAALGAVRIDGIISGTDINSGLVINDATADTTDQWFVDRAPVVGITSFKASQYYVTRGQTVPWTITMVVKNNAASAVRFDGADLKFIFSGTDVSAEYLVIDPFEFATQGSTELPGHTEDSLRFKITRTGQTLGPITVEGSVDLIDLMTMKSMHRSQTTGITVQNPANLVVRKVILSQASATVLQTVDWNIKVVVSNDGEGDITIDGSPDSTGITFNPSDGFVISPPRSLVKSGDFILRGNQVDTLIFTMDVTGDVLGWVNILAHVTGTENNSGNQVHASSSENVRVKIEKPAQLQLYSVISKAPNQRYVNIGQNYKIQVRVQNPGDVDSDGVHAIRVVLVSDGASIDTLQQVIGNVPPGSIRSALFDIIAPEVTNPGEIFEAKILSAKSDNTNENISVNPAVDSTEIIATQTPAKLRIPDVITPTHIFADQHKEWNIQVVVVDSGGAELVLSKPSSQDIQVYINTVLQKDYIIEPPSELKSGGLTLSSGIIDTLVYTVTNTGNNSGDAVLKINLQAVDKNDQRNINETQSRSIYIESSVKITIEQTLLRGCNRIDEQRGKVNKGQTFRVTAKIKNYGHEPVDNIIVELTSDGGSLITESKSEIQALDPDKSDVDSVYYTIIADSVEGYETFTARIISATVRSSARPAEIESKYDSTAIVMKQERATLRPEIKHSAGDNNLTRNQIVTIRTVVHNLGGAEVDDSGVLEFIAPENYRIISPTDDTTRGISKSSFKPNEEIIWRLITPKNASGPDLLILSLSKIPIDLNTGQPAFWIARQDTFSIRVLETSLYVNSFEISFPDGAKDGTVSSDQDFQVTAMISYSQNLTAVQARVEPPEYSKFIFPNGGKIKSNISPGRVDWDLRTGGRSVGDTLRLIVTANEKRESILVDDSYVVINTVENARLQLTAKISHPAGAEDGTLSIGQPFEITATVTNDTQRAGIYGRSQVKLDLGASGCETQDSLFQSFEVGLAAKWSIVAPSEVTTSADIMLTLVEIPFDENTDKTATIAPDGDRATISVRTEKLGIIQTALSIHNPPGAKDGILSTGQYFDIEATVNSEGVDSIRCELILPDDKDFSLGQAESRIKSVSGVDAVRWQVQAPDDTAKSAGLRIVTTGYDQNFDQKIIYGNPDTLTVSVIDKALLLLKAAIVSPHEARDNMVSPGTEFVVQAEVENEGSAQVFGRLNVELEFIDSDYTVPDTVIQSLSDGFAQWRIRAPAFRKDYKKLTVKWKKIPNDENTDKTATIKNQDVDIFISTETKSLIIAPTKDVTPRSTVRGAQDVTILGLYFENSEKGDYSSGVLLRKLKLRLEDRKGNLLADPSKIISRLAVVENSNHATIFAESESNSLQQNPAILQFSTDFKVSSPNPDSLSLIVDIAENAEFGDFRIKIDSTSWFDVVIEQTEELRPVITSQSGGKPLTVLVDLVSDYTVIMEPDLKSTFLNYPNPFGSSEKMETNFIYYLKQDTDIELRIYSLIGELVWKKHYSSSDPRGKQGMHDKGNFRSIAWDGRNGAGHRVLNGVYIALFSTSYGETAMTKTAVIK